MNATDQAAADLAELQFTPIPTDEIAGLEDRLYLLGVRLEAVRS